MRRKFLNGTSLPPLRGLLVANTYYEDLPLPDRVFGADTPLISASCTGEAFAKLQQGLRVDGLVLSRSSSNIALDASDEALTRLEHKGTLRLPDEDEVLPHVPEPTRRLLKSECMTVQPSFLMDGPYALNLIALLGGLNVAEQEVGNDKVYGLVLLTHITYAHQRHKDHYTIDLLSSKPGLKSTDDLYFFREYHNTFGQGAHERWRAFVPRSQVEPETDSTSRASSPSLTDGALPQPSALDQPAHPAAHSLLESSTLQTPARDIETTDGPVPMDTDDTSDDAQAGAEDESIEIDLTSLPCQHLHLQEEASSASLEPDGSHNDRSKDIGDPLRATHAELLHQTSSEPLDATAVSKPRNVSDSTDAVRPTRMPFTHHDNFTSDVGAVASTHNFTPVSSPNAGSSSGGFSSDQARQPHEDGLTALDSEHVNRSYQVPVANAQVPRFNTPLQPGMTGDIEQNVANQEHQITAHTEATQSMRQTPRQESPAGLNPYLSSSFGTAMPPFLN